jgi:hypothetical protein
MPRKLRYNYGVQGVSEIRDTTSGGHILYTRTTKKSSSAWFLGRFVSELRPALFCKDWDRKCKTDGSKSLCRGLPTAVLATKNRNKHTNC